MTWLADMAIRRPDVVEMIVSAVGYWVVSWVS